MPDLNQLPLKSPANLLAVLEALKVAMVELIYIKDHGEQFGGLSAEYAQDTLKRINAILDD